jgi:hypothetical protein
MFQRAVEQRGRGGADKQDKERCAIHDRSARQSLFLRLGQRLWKRHDLSASRIRVCGLLLRKDVTQWRYDKLTGFSVIFDGRPISLELSDLAHGLRSLCTAFQRAWPSVGEDRSLRLDFSDVALTRQKYLWFKFSEVRTAPGRLRSTGLPKI